MCVYVFMCVCVCVCVCVVVVMVCGGVKARAEVSSKMSGEIAGPVVWRGARVLYVWWG